MNLRLVGRWKNFLHFVNAIYQTVKYGYPARTLTVIGVTGTDGKTTVVHLIAKILEQAGIKTAAISTVGAFFNGQSVDTGFHVTTPDPQFLQAFLLRVKNEDITHVMMEATSHGLDQHRVLGCNFKVGVLTNITHEHLDYHRTPERYRQAKAKLFRGVKVAVLNADDPSCSYIKDKTNSSAKIISYSLRKHAALWASAIRIQHSGMKFTIHEGGKFHSIETKLIGEHNVSNILAACGAAKGLGIKWDDIVGGIRDFGGVEGRMELIDQGQKFTVIVDFAHTPAALENLLRTLDRVKLHKDSKIILVFGAPGERDPSKRKPMGEAAVKHADFCVLTTDDPRHEDSNRIIDEITRGIRDKASVWDGLVDWRKKGKWCIRILDRGEAISFAIQKLANAGDIVVLAGQGHQKAMPFGDREIPWSDQEAARVALRGGIKKLGVLNPKS